MPALCQSRVSARSAFLAAPPPWPTRGRTTTTRCGRGAWGARGSCPGCSRGLTAALSPQAAYDPYAYSNDYDMHTGECEGSTRAPGLLSPGWVCGPGPGRAAAASLILPHCSSLTASPSPQETPSKTWPTSASTNSRPTR